MEWNKLVPELSVTRMTVSHNFYVHILGFECLFERDDPPFRYLSFEGAQLMLEEGEGWETGERVYPFGRGINLQIECCDAQSLRDRVLAAGVPLYRDLKTSHYQVGDAFYGAREFLVQDPDGYLLRFTEDLGVVTGDVAVGD